MSSISIREMLECGVHFGHPTRRWNPKMKKYIFGERNGISIIDLQRSARLAKKALNYARQIAAEGGDILFVGTKRQAMDVIRDQAERAEAFYVNQRWLGGMMTNFSTIQGSIRKLKDLENQLDDEDRTAHLKKKELLQLDRERERLDKVLHGIKDMRRLPAAIFIVDVQKEHIAVSEANKLHIPVIAIVDSNCDPEPVDYIIPGNDDAIRSIQLFAEKLADAVIDGREEFKAKRAEEERKKAEERAALEKRRADEKAQRDKERKEREKQAKQRKEAQAAEAAEKKAEAAKKEAAEPAKDKKPARATKKPDDAIAEAKKAEPKKAEPKQAEAKKDEKEAPAKKETDKSEAKKSPAKAEKKDADTKKEDARDEDSDK